MHELSDESIHQRKQLTISSYGVEMDEKQKSHNRFVRLVSHLVHSHHHRLSVFCRFDGQSEKRKEQKSVIPANTWTDWDSQWKLQENPVEINRLTCTLVIRSNELLYGLRIFRKIYLNECDNICG